MELKIKKDEYNPLLKRKEVYADAYHENEGSPSRSALRDAVASKYGVESEVVYVVDIHTRTGNQESECLIQVYDDQATAKLIVPEYVRVRNLPSEERKKVREQKAKKKEEKPKETPKKEAKPKEAPASPPKAQVKEPTEAKELSKGSKETPKSKPKETENK